MKQDSPSKRRTGRRFWLSVLAISLGVLGIGELLVRRDTLSLLYSLPSPRFVVVILVGIALTGGCLLLIWIYPRVQMARPRLALIVTFLTSFCLIAALLLLSDSVFVITQGAYQESETIGLSTYRMSVDDLGQLSDIHQVDVVLTIATPWASSAGRPAAGALTQPPPTKAVWTSTPPQAVFNSASRTPRFFPAE